jgi:hypothetical protein
MDSEILILLAVTLVAITSMILLTSRNWIWTILALALQYVGVFILVAASWTLTLSITKIVVGWMAAAVLGMVMVATPEAIRQEEPHWPSGRIFRLLTSGLVFLAVFSTSPKAAEFVPGTDPVTISGGLILIGMGLLHLSLTSQPLRTAIGILTFLSGFEIIYASVETSTLVADLLAVINMGIALVGAYLLVMPTLEKVD